MWFVFLIILECTKDASFVADNKATINETLITVIQHQLQYNHGKYFNNNHGAIFKADLNYLEPKHADVSNRNLVQMDSDSDCGLFSSCESNFDDENQSIVNSIVSGSSLPCINDSGCQGIL